MYVIITELLSFLLTSLSSLLSYLRIVVSLYIFLWSVVTTLLAGRSAVQIPAEARVFSLL
jgi:hypothetical protein